MYFSLSPSQAPIETAYLYDATYLYAIGVNKTLAEGKNATDGRAVMKNLYGHPYSSKRLIGGAIVV